MTTRAGQRQEIHGVTRTSSAVEDLPNQELFEDAAVAWYSSAVVVDHPNDHPRVDAGRQRVGIVTPCPNSVTSPDPFDRQ